jgi:hypothetical protein
MPTFRKLDPIDGEPKPRPLSKRAQVAREYDAYVADFTVGDYGRAELLDGEQRALVRQRLQAAAKRSGLILRFRSGPGPLIFQVTATPTISTPPPQEPSAITSVAPVTVDRRSQRPPRPPRQRKSAAERYRDVLPRWMRDGQHEGKRNGSTKRRSR